MTRCNVCGRPLKTAESIAAGIGPWCKHQHDSSLEMPSGEVLREIIRREENRRYDHDRDYRNVFCFRDSVSLRQIRADLLDALSAGERFGLGYEEQRQRNRKAILAAIDRAEAYGGCSMEMVAMLVVIAIEHFIEGTETRNDERNLIA